MHTKQEILDEIRRTASENGGKALGVARFEGETGIKPYDWEKYWARFGDAVEEAGFVANRLQSAHSTAFLLEKLVGLSRKLDKFPTFREITVEGNHDREFPSKKAFQRLGSKGQLAKKVLEYCAGRNEYEDVTAHCTAELKESGERTTISGETGSTLIGEVYLIKSGRHYKIGRTSDTVRRGSEIRIQLPEKMTLVHSIKTDDPNGVEAYWHKRLDSKRMNGEWFDLSSTDVKAFKRWRRIL